MTYGQELSDRKSIPDGRAGRKSRLLTWRAPSGFAFMVSPGRQLGGYADYADIGAKAACQDVRSGPAVIVS